MKMGILDILTSKTAWAAIGLVGMGLYQLSQGDYPAAIQSFMAALAALGVRDALQPVQPTK